MKALLLAINSKYIHTALGIRSVSAFCLKKKQNVSFIEKTIQTPVLTVLSEVYAVGPDVLGLDVHIWNKEYVYKLAALVRQVLPETIIVLGGPEVSFTPKTALQECCAVNYVVQGEGEEIFSALLMSLQEGLPIPEHVTYMIEGVIRESTPAIVENLDELPFAYPDLADVVAQHRIVYYETIRGCPFSCSYCLSGISHSLRRRSLPKVYRDIEQMLAAKVPLIKLVDRTFNLNEDFYLPILSKIASLNTETTFHLEIKADMLSEKVMAFLQNMPNGRIQMEIGVQTTNKHTLETIGRKDDWQKLSKNIKQLLVYQNMHIHVDLIAGLPYEDLLSFKSSFNETYALGAQALQLGFLKVLPGSKIALEAEKYGLIHMQSPPYEILQTTFLSYDELRFLKILEDVFDHTYNAGCFPNTLAYFVKAYQDDAYSFYEALAKWWEEQGLYHVGHNIKKTAVLLLRFAQIVLPDTAELQERLRFDIFLYQRDYRPNEFGWHDKEDKELIMEFWRHIDSVHKYLPEYDFSTWRQVRRYLPIERFSWQPAGEYGKTYYILGDYRAKKPYYFVLDNEDFIDKNC